jgi:hypothetical protein
MRHCCDVRVSWPLSWFHFRSERLQLLTSAPPQLLTELLDVVPLQGRVKQ